MNSKILIALFCVSLLQICAAQIQFVDGEASWPELLRSKRSDVIGEGSGEASGEASGESSGEKEKDVVEASGEASGEGSGESSGESSGSEPSFITTTPIDNALPTEPTSDVLTEETTSV